MGGEITQINSASDAFFGRVKKIQENRERNRKEIARFEDELEGIAAKLRGSPREDVKDLQHQQERIQEQQQDLARDEGGCLREIQNIRDEIAILDERIEKHSAKQGKQDLAKRRVQAARDATSRVEKIREILEEEFRKDLESRVTRLFQQISPTPYIPVLEKDYSIRLIESAGGKALPVAASTGESQILSLSFIGSIIELAREYSKRKEKLPGPDSRCYPLVMDSPFGSLDPNHRLHVAENLPRLADQVVVMVSGTQWRGEVEHSMDEYVGRSYVLTYASPRSEIEPSNISLGGHEYPLVVKSPNQYEYTEIVEVTHG